MSKYRTIEVWNELFGNKETVTDYAGRVIKSLLVETQTALTIQRLIILDRFQKAGATSLIIL